LERDKIICWPSPGLGQGRRWKKRLITTRAIANGSPIAIRLLKMRLKKGEKMNLGVPDGNLPNIHQTRGTFGRKYWGHPSGLEI